MVMNLDKCIGCHTCSITCKNVWTNREGAEYMYFNNVETKPGIGYPKNWEDQEKWKGGWKLGKDGKLSLRTGSKPERLLKLFYHPDQPEMDDYYEPWTYDYETLIHSKRRNHQPIARPRSLVTGERMEIKWGPNWEDDLANGESARQDINLKKMAADITLEFHDLFMKYLPRVCNHCLNPACVAACPSGAIYKREEDGVVLVSQDGCRGWRHCVPACPYKKVYFNWKTNKAEKCIFCFPRLENGLPTICADTCVGRLRYMGVLLYDMDKVVPAASTRDKGEIYHQVLDVIADPNDPEVIEAARKEGMASPRTGSRRLRTRRSTRLSRTGSSLCRSIRSSARCQWSGTCRLSRQSRAAQRPTAICRRSTRCASPSRTSRRSSRPATRPS